MPRSLIISVLRPPDPARDHHGVYQRLRMLVQVLARFGGPLTMVHFVPPGETGAEAERKAARIGSAFWGTPVSVRLLPLDRSQRKAWQTAQVPFSLRYRGEHAPFLGARQRAGLLDVLDEGHDLILAHRLPVMEALMRTARRLPPVFFDLDDVEHLVKLRAAEMARSIPQGLRWRLETAALAKAERRAIAAATLTFICSGHDHDRLAAEGFDTGRVVTVPNSVPMPDERPRLSDSRTALFIGNYGHAPNAEAADRLITLIWPLVRARVPQAELIIAGGSPEKIRCFNEKPEGVLFTGYADDLDALYNRTRIICCPLRNGGGTRIKLIEAACRGKPIAATHIAAEGLAFRDPRDILLADDDVSLAEAAVRLLTDDALAKAQAESAFTVAKALYSLPHIQGLVSAAMRSRLSMPGRGQPAPAQPAGLQRAATHLTATPAQGGFDEARR